MPPKPNSANRRSVVTIAEGSNNSSSSSSSSSPEVFSEKPPQAVQAPAPAASSSSARGGGKSVAAARPAPKGSGRAAMMSRFAQQRQQQADAENSKPKEKAMSMEEASWYQFKNLNTASMPILGSAVAPKERWVSFHLRAPGSNVPFDSVIRVHPAATISFLKDRISAHHGNTVKHIQLFKDAYKGEKILTDTVIGPEFNNTSVRAVFNLEEMDHNPVHLPMSFGLGSSSSSAYHRGAGGSSVFPSKMGSPSSSVLFSEDSRAKSLVSREGSSSTFRRNQTLSPSASMSRPVNTSSSDELTGMGSPVASVFVNSNRAVPGAAGTSSQPGSPRSSFWGGPGSTTSTANNSPHFQHQQQQQEPEPGALFREQLQKSGAYFVSDLAAKTSLHPHDSNSPERKAETSLHMEDDHVVLYYAFAAHDFPSALLYAH